MYFLYNKSLNSFYGITGSWIPREVAKKALERLCIFEDIFDAQSCKQQGRFRGNIMILNEKSMKNKLKIKNLSSIRANWRAGGILETPMAKEKKNISSNTDGHEFFADDKNSKKQKKDDMTFCEYLDQLSNDVIHQDGGRKYLQSRLPEEVLNTDLIKETLKYLAMTRRILELWTARMKVVDSDIIQYESQISDELHFLELLSNLPDQDLINCAKRVQDIRRDRRVAKNERAIGKQFLPMIQSGIDVDKIDALEKAMDQMQNRVYRVRQPDAKVNITTTLNSDHDDIL